ncbi:YraN family protein [Flagellimonas sp. S3867]|uniref:YraN family protein n=1 Tax=Flagellimonas sp. S3867 TaxID=2768063 RepID=UPI001687EBE8|nr:YraN family protein [Flagellimonas sp. S3867]
MGKHNEFGRLGEQKAVDFLIKRGYKIQKTNYRYLKAEVDIIAQKEGILCVIEVKSRTGGFLEDVSETINQKKINLLVMAANHYVEENNLDVEVRFDIILIIKKGTTFEVEHTKNAFYHF